MLDELNGTPKKAKTSTTVTYLLVKPKSKLLIGTLLKSNWLNTSHIPNQNSIFQF